MKIFVVNCGSSSIKYQLIDMKDESVIAKGLVERIGIEGSVLTHTPAGKDKVRLESAIPDHVDGIKKVLAALVDPNHGVIKSMDEIDAVGHRVVHGGEIFNESVVITDEVLKQIEDLSDMAPLHQPANVSGIRACQKLMPNTPQVAVFDTAFHQTMPPVAYMFGVKYEEYKDYGIRKYGFHGTSHKYVSGVAAQLLGKDIKDTKIITCHLGNGSSITAVDGGKSVDTSMGFTPLDGVLMGTRTGSIDPAVVPVLMQKKGLDAAGVDKYMNKECGVLGVSGVSSDFRDLEDAAAKGNERAQLALDMFCYQVKRYVGAYAAAMGGVDAIVFTAGVGENDIHTRQQVCAGLEFLGVKLDADRNNVRGKVTEISAADSKVKVFLIPTNEELAIAQDTLRLCSK
ncbi:acetate/propionate family kinase [Acidaminococcus fermentans]|uniref:Acetate kinase n=2 Tax=Acidaminococcus fermentans TaxID=905 RepID=D2RL08_ACIFV|nr:acetate kinase [Acidaminococcus fermentans]ADB47760.1 acetate kinase [Acidaminococcus fermentans DSM 20731]MCF0138562.1 acetate kinase [Acidaminococcus fermentans]MCI6286905.1 acetate kinase [Acidaminococcus fermentans]MCI7195662.1 acetate kinase [Acidaminococcus fermentans]MDD7195446.1 acetate kinase [Acidaminococcus fermentans]